MKGTYGFWDSWKELFANTNEDYLKHKTRFDGFIVVDKSKEIYNV